MGEGPVERHERIFGKVKPPEKIDAHVIDRTASHTKAPTAPVRGTDNAKYAEKAKKVFG